MLRVWYLLCFFFGSGLTSSAVRRQDGSILEEDESVLKDVPTTGIMLVRMKRSPARTMTISGYMPHGGLSYASTDLFPYNSMGYPGGMDMWPYSGPVQSRVPSKDLQPPARSDFYGPPEDNVAPVTENEPSWPEKDPGVGSSNNGMTAYSIPKKTKKKQWFQKVSPATTADEDAEEEYYKGDGAAKAHASFNAWFPIMLGVFPNGQGGGGDPGEAAQRGSYPPSSPSHGQPSNGPQGSYGSQGSRPSHTQSQSPLQRYYSTTVIANSVNNGKSGIASSTATAYGGDQPQQQPRHNA